MEKDLDNIIAVQKIQDYIEKHINESITLYELAKCAGYSPWYCTKIFKDLVGKTIFEYIRAIRLTSAAMELRDGNKKILDVSLDFLFDSHEGFTRAFRRQFGITPKDYQKNTPPIFLYKVYPVKDLYLTMKNRQNDFLKEETMKVHNYFTQIMNFPKRKLILKRGITATEYFKYCEEVGEIWGLLCSIKEALNEPMGIWLSERYIKPGTSKYVQGVEVPYDYKGVVPEGLDIIDLPECQMLIFQGEPFEEENFMEEIVDLEKYINKFNPSVYGFEWEEEGYRFQFEPQGYRGYIEGRTIKKID